MRKVASTLLVLTTIIALAACGGSSNKNSAGSSTSPSSRSSSASSSSVAAGGTSGDFCKDIVNSKADQIGEDPNGAKQALAVLKGLTPPDEIKSDWDDYLGALKQLSEADQNDQSTLARIAAAHIKSLSAVSLYISKSCLNLSSTDLSSLSDSLSSFSDSASSTGN